VTDPNLSSDPVFKRLLEAIVQSVGADLVRFGDVDLSEMTDDEFRDRVRSELRGWTGSEAKFRFVLGHQDGLLDQARLHREQRETDYSIIFYATWIEHWFNSMFGWKAKMLSIPGNDVERLMRQGIIDKAGVSWRLCFGTDFPDDLRKSIVRISTRRNSFVHYKWRSVDPDEDRRAEEVELLQLAESVVGELDELENQLMYGGLRARAHSGFSDPANESPGNPWSPRGTLDLNKQRNSGAR
jgi:hypothetical protein